MDEKFWQRINEIVFSSKIVIDRPKGSAHPRYPNFIYPLDYGFLKNSKASDGAEIDIWKGSLNKNKVIGVLCTIDNLKRDLETKILVD